MNTTPVSCTPRMFTSGKNGQHSKAQRQRVRLQAGTAEISAPTPAEMPTAAVRV